MTDSLHVYLSGSKVHTRRKGGWPWRWSVEELGRSAWDLAHPDSLNFNGLQPDKTKRRQLHVYLGSALCRLMVVPAPADLRNDAERQSVAGAYMSHNLGLSPSAWRITTEAGPARNTLFACAVPLNVLTRLEELAQEHALKLMSIQPFAQGVWNAFSKAPQRLKRSSVSLLAVEPDALTTFTAHDNVLQFMGTLHYRQEDGFVDREIRRLMLSSTDPDHVIEVAACASAVDHGVQPERLLLKRDFMKSDLCLDFSDLLFSSIGES